MTTKHEINGRIVSIDWERGELIESYGGGEKHYAMHGSNEYNNYIGTGIYQNGEFVEVVEVEDF